MGYPSWEVRDEVRQVALARTGVTPSAWVATQWSASLVFAGLLGAGAWLVARMVGELARGRATLLLLVAITGTTLPARPAENPDRDAQVEQAVERARAAAKSLATEMRTLLQEEMSAGGPASAIKICSEAAQAITEAHRERSGVDIRRVSLRARNPVNTPDAIEKAALEGFEGLAPEERGDAEHVQVVKVGKRRVLRFMTPLYASPVCLHCHGVKESMAPSVRSVIASQYPEDRATGFKEGDLRGAISVRVDVDQP